VQAGRRRAATGGARARGRGAAGLGPSARRARARCAKSNLAARLEQAEGHLMALLRGREGSIGEVVEAKLALAQAEFERLRVQARRRHLALSRQALGGPRRLSRCCRLCVARSPGAGVLSARAAAAARCAALPGHLGTRGRA
jgi:hypothetical protein